MVTGNNKAREIDPGENFGDGVVKANGAQVSIDADGSIHGLPAPANDTAKGKTTPEIGDEMKDGTILAGYYKGKPLYAQPQDESGTYTFNEAAKQAKKVGGGFHVPSKGELNVLWENRNKGKLKGTFNETGSYPAGWYGSSSPDDYYTEWAQRFSDGGQSNFYYRNNDSSLRLVR